MATFTKALVSSPELLDRYNFAVLDTSAGGEREVVGQKRLTARGLLRYVRIAARVLSMVARFRPAIVHVQVAAGDLAFPGEALRLASARSTGAQVICHFHRDPDTFWFPNRNWATRTGFRAAMRSVDHLVTLSPTYRERLLPLFPGPITVIPNTCDPQLIGAAQGTRRCRGDGLRILFLGRLSREKGVLDLLGALHLLRGKLGVPARLRLAGVSPTPVEEQAVADRISSLGLASVVELLGTVGGSKKLEFLASGDVLVLPSYRESFGICLIEAMAAGLPVVATRTGVIPEILAGDAGLLVDKGAPSQLAEALARLARDNGFREQIARRSHERFLANYAPAVVWRSVAELYGDLLAS